MSTPILLFQIANWASYSAALKRHGSLMVWLDPEISWFTLPNGRPGHPERLSVAIQFCLSIKVLFRLLCHPTIKL